MLSSLNGLYDQICEFLCEFTMVVNNEEAILNLSYMFMHYDLIDVDLDFDELYYYEIKSSWERLLDNTIKEMIQEGNIKNAIINRKDQISRKESIQSLERRYCLCDDGRIEMITKEYV